LKDNIGYRTGTKKDIPDILRVIKAAFEEYRDILDPPSSAQHKTVEVVEKELSEATAILAASDGELVGCVFYQVKGYSVYLDRLSVLPAWRGKGIAGELIDLVEQRALAMGENRVRLSVRGSLEGHHAYYKKKGYVFKEYGTHKGYDEPTFLVLEKELVP
jgi:predicted N-acetyltransferase YhbS